MKINSRQIKSLRDIKRLGGIVASSKWTNGSGRYTTKRAIPPHCRMIEFYAAGAYPKRIRDFFRQNPRVQRAVAIVDMRAANRVCAK